MIPLWWLLCQGCAAVAPVGDVAPQPIEVVAYSFGQPNDLDLDREPDDWVRRKGAQFPRYVSVGIDDAVGRTDSHSLRFKLNGGAAAYYSPLTPIDGLHTYYFEGFIRAEGLKYDAAMISISLLNHKRERVQRFLSKPVVGKTAPGTTATGLRADWLPIQLGPIVPDLSVRFVVIGCHIVPGVGDQRDMRGNVWFDDLSWGRLPRMELENNFFRHFLSEDAPVRVMWRVSGLDPNHVYALRLSLRDVNRAIIAETESPLAPDVPPPSTGPLRDEHLPQPQVWEPGRQPLGFYQVAAVLMRDGAAAAQQQTTLAVVDPIDHPRKSGEFGWSLMEELPDRQRDELPQIAVQAGINWLKYPLWKVAIADTAQRAGNVATFLDRLMAVGVTPVGVLGEPPPVIRNKFARNWQGVSEVFALPPEFWRRSLEPVVARFSSNVHTWQLGTDDDGSFVGISNLPMILRDVRQEIRRISLNAQIGVPWTPSVPVPAGCPLGFASLTAMPDEPAVDMNLLPKGVAPWTIIRPTQFATTDLATRAKLLARALIAAKVAGSPAIFVGDVYHPEVGLLRSNGAPADLFLPWRTVTLALQGAEYLGSFTMPNGTPNAVFARDGEAIVALWNDTESRESLYFGEQPVAVDLWGRRTPLRADPKTGEQAITVGPAPVFVRAGSESVARWRIAAQFEIGRMKSEHGQHQDAVIGRNTFPQGVSGTVSVDLPDEWESEPREWTLQAAAGETYRHPVRLTLPTNARLGDQLMSLNFKLEADRPYRFRVHRIYQVGLGEVTIEVFDRRLPDGRLEIEQLVTNRTNPPEVFNFRCALFVPNFRRQKLQITRLGQGIDRKFYYLPDAKAMRGETLGLRLEQDGGRRVLNYFWKVGADWDNPKSPSTEPNSQF